MIYIGFGADNSFRSRLIQWATGSEWNHVWIEYPSECWGGQWVAHSTEKGVIKEPRDRVYSRYDKKCIFEVKEFDLTVGMRASRDLLGRDYDYKVIWNAVLLIFFRSWGWKWLWKWASRDISKVTCSEFVGTVIKNSNGPKLEKDPEFLPPGDIYSFCIRYLGLKR